MADVAVAVSDSYTTKLSTASTDDVMVMGNGEHVTPGDHSINQRQSIGKRVTTRAAGWSEPDWVGRYVKNNVGHVKSDWPSQWRGGWSISASGGTYRGMLFVGRMDGGAGSIGIQADSLLFEDCGFTDDFGYIMSILGSSGAVSNIRFRRCRFWNIGSRGAHDHPLYWQNTSTTLGRCTVEDSIFYNHTGWAMHCYPNGDGVLYKRCLVYRANGAGVFSALSGNVTSGAGFENCLLVDAQGSGIGSFAPQHPRYLVEYVTGGSGYVQDTMAVNNSPGPNVPGTIASNPAITKTRVLETGTPLWAAGTNPMATGDFRLSSNPSNPALGYGPTYIQPSSGSTPVATAGTNVSVSVVSGARSAVHFRNDPDRVTPGA